MSNTTTQYNEIIAECTDIFTKKMQDYGTAWRILRPASITDQIFIKAKRIKTLQKTTNQRIDEGIEPEFIGIINYCIMGLIQLTHGDIETLKDHLTKEDIKKLYDEIFQTTKDLMLDKNHDYGEAWRSMRVSSITDLILMKILRIKKIEDNNGDTIISEGIDANYMDIINYSVFSLILLKQ